MLSKSNVVWPLVFGLSVILSLNFILAEVSIAQEDAEAVTIKSTVAITSIDGEPAQQETIMHVGNQTLVRCSVSDTSMYVFLLVHPLLGSEWWVQKKMTRIPQDTRQGIALLGSEKQGKGEYYEIAAVATPNKNLYKEGQILDALPNKLSRSQIVVVSREEPIFDTLNVDSVGSAIPKVGWKVLILGRAPSSHQSVYVAVHPSNSDTWWIQNIPSPPNENGSWQSMCFFGNEKQGIGELFEVAVAYQDEPNLYKLGQQLSSAPDNSRIVTVKRVR